MKVGYNKSSEILAFVLFYLNCSLNDGHTCLTKITLNIGCKWHVTILKRRLKRVIQDISLKVNSEAVCEWNPKERP